MTTATPTAMQRLMRMSLISQIAIGSVLGIALALLANIPLRLELSKRLGLHEAARGEFRQLERV